MNGAHRYCLDLAARDATLRQADVRAWIAEWIRSDAFAELADLWPLEAPPLDPEAGLEWWGGASEVFDYRGGGAYLERWQARVDTGLDAVKRSKVLSIGERLGLVSVLPPVGRDFDAVIVMGAGGVSPHMRAEYAAELLRSGTVRAPAVYLLGSVRPIGHDRHRPDIPSEAERVRAFAPDACDEFGLVLAAAKEHLGVPDEPCIDISPTRQRVRNHDEIAADWLVRAFDVDGRRVVVLRATRLTHDPGRPEYRPSTVDTLVMLTKAVRPRPGERILVVTTQIFVPFQAFDVVRMLGLPFGTSVETVGFPNSAMDREPTPEVILQEIRSAIRACRALWDAASGRTPWNQSVL